jgi:hypothetical protein
MLFVFTVSASRHCCLVTVLGKILWVQRGFPGWARKASFSPILIAYPQLRCIVLMFHWVNVGIKCKSKCSLTDGYGCCAWEQMVIELAFLSLQQSTVISNTAVSICLYTCISISVSIQSKHQNLWQYKKWVPSFLRMSTIYGLNLRCSIPKCLYNVMVWKSVKHNNSKY